MRVFGEVVLFQAIKQWLERLHDARLINRVDNHTLSIGIFCDDTVCYEFFHLFIARIETDAFLRRGNLHQDAFKSWISLDISSQMSKIGVVFL